MHTSAMLNRLRWVAVAALMIPLLGFLSAPPAAAQLLGSTTSTDTTTTSTVTTDVTNTLNNVLATGPDVVLYEVTEAVGSKGGTQSGFKSSVATLSGVARSGVAPCPPAIASDMLKGCWVVVRAVGRADDVTGIGPVVGSFEVVVQDKNSVDSPEVVVLRGHISGDLDLSPAFQRSTPVGTVAGTYTLRGVRGTLMDGQTVRGGFTGTFRLPYSEGGQAYYMTDGGRIPVAAAEYVLGYPAVKLEVTLK